MQQEVWGEKIQNNQEFHSILTGQGSFT